MLADVIEVNQRQNGCTLDDAVVSSGGGGRGGGSGGGGICDSRNGTSGQVLMVDNLHSALIGRTKVTLRRMSLTQGQIERCELKFFLIFFGEDPLRSMCLLNL